MMRRLAFLLAGSGAFALVLTVAYNRFFSDILPLATTEPQSLWRFETAFVLTSITWIAAAVAALSAMGLLLFLIRSPHASLNAPED
jgi:hypothetical protein